MASQGVDVEGRLLISDRAHLLFDLHKEIDGLREEELAGNYKDAAHCQSCRCCKAETQFHIYNVQFDA